MAWCAALWYSRSLDVVTVVRKVLTQGTEYSGTPLREVDTTL